MVIVLVKVQQNGKLRGATYGAGTFECVGQVLEVVGMAGGIFVPCRNVVNTRGKAEAAGDKRAALAPGRITMIGRP